MNDDYLGQARSDLQQRMAEISQSKSKLSTEDFVTHTASDTLQGQASRRKKLDTYRGTLSQPELQQKLLEHPPPPELMGALGVKVGLEGDSLVFARHKTHGDMLHFTSNEGRTGIVAHNIMYPSMLDKKTNAHFGPGVYFTDPSIVHDMTGGVMTHEAVQTALYTRPSTKNAQRSAYVLSTHPEVFTQHTVNTYDLMASRLPQMKAELTQRKQSTLKPRLEGVSAEWHAGDANARRRVHKLETELPEYVPLYPPRTTGEWVQHAQTTMGQDIFPLVKGKPLERRADLLARKQNTLPGRKMDLGGLSAEWQGGDTRRRISIHK